MSITKEDVASAVEDWAAAYNERDSTRAFAMEAGGAGFGYRTRQWRDLGSTDGPYFQFTGAWLSGLTYFSLVMEELHTRVVGDTGFAWGVYIEETEAPGQPRERARVRFSKALQRDTEGNWHILLVHRDVQPFDDAGVYLKPAVEA